MYTIYTVSDPATVGTAMQAMAMFFGQESWVASALKTALMISLIYILGQGVTRNGLRLDAMLLQLIVIWAAFMPKTTVVIEQFENASPPRIVDGIPYAIALPATVAGAFSLYMTRNIETVTQSVEGRVLSVAEGTSPFTPARMLLSFALCPHDPVGCVDKNLIETMSLAARYCANGELSKIQFSQNPTVLTSFANTLTKVGSTIIYDSNTPYVNGGGSGRSASCDEVAGYLRQLAENAGNDGANIATFEGVFKSISEKGEVKNYKSIRENTTSMPSWEENLQKINTITSGTSTLDNHAFTNLLTYSIADAVKYSAGAPLDQSIMIKKDTGLFEWAKSESMQSMLVNATAPKFMDILFFIFICSTPFVMFVVAANPMTGLKTAVAYTMFGLWTQSWTPMMAIVMSWYQVELANFIPKLGSESLNAHQLSSLMRHVMTTTIAASNMLQQAPYIMFAIMSGSMFAMSGLISKAMPAGNNDSGIPGANNKSGDNKVGANTVGGANGVPAPTAQLGNVAAAQSMLGSGTMSGGFQGGSGGVSAAMGGAMPQIDLAGSVSKGVSTAVEKAASRETSLAAQAQTVAGALASLTESGAKTLKGATSATATKGSGFSSDKDTALKENKGATSGEALDVGTNKTISNTASVQAAGGADVNTGLNLGKKQRADVANKLGDLGKQSQIEAAKGLDALKNGNQAAADAHFKAASEAAKQHDKLSSSLSDGSAAKAGLKFGVNAGALVANKDDNSVALKRNKANNEGLQYESGSRFGLSSGEEQKTSSTGGKEFSHSAVGALANTLQKAYSDIQGEMVKAQTAQKTGEAVQSEARAAGLQKVDGSALASSYASSEMARNPGAGNRQIGESLQSLFGAVGTSVGAENMPKFQSDVQARAGTLLKEGKGISMSNDQIAAAAAVQTLNSMINSGDTSLAAGGVGGVLRMAEASNMSTGVNAEILQKANDFVSSTNQAIDRDLKEIGHGSGAISARVMDKMDSAEAVAAAVPGAIQEAKNNAQSIATAANTANPLATGIALVPKIDRQNRDEVASAVKNQDLAQASIDNRHGMPLLSTTDNSVDHVQNSAERGKGQQSMWTAIAGNFLNGNSQPQPQPQPQNNNTAAGSIGANISGATESAKAVAGGIGANISGATESGRAAASELVGTISSAVQQGAPLNAEMSAPATTNSASSMQGSSDTGGGGSTTTVNNISSGSQGNEGLPTLGSSPSLMGGGSPMSGGGQGMQAVSSNPDPSSSKPNVQKNNSGGKSVGDKKIAGR